ncbi:hypothetical protein RhiirA5_369343 [Rhizophagus irregularis]|uniref:Uncharacterized protein n=1 Tax=Rhizophagus irregularis TaxID=588596 RepID=A0A2N0QD90_9GLOM|nr:hypothetical protein RhiirA5_369343 [Rhizophagus irregularis]
MEKYSIQNRGSSSLSNLENNTVIFKPPLLKNTSNNRILLELEKDGFYSPDEKVEELINKNLTNLEYLFALKLLFENPLNQFSDGILRNSLVTLADPIHFDYYGKQSMVRLELHLRTWVAVLEKICVTPMRLSKELRDKVYNSLAKFAEIHNKTTQVMQEGIDNNYRSGFNQFNQLQQDDKENGNFINKRNYNIDFLLIHLRDTLHSLRDDETLFQEIIRRSKELLKAVFSITPPSTATGITPKDVSSLFSILTHLRKGLSFKYPVSSYYLDWRIMLIIQHNLFTWCDTEIAISKKFQEMILMEYFWSYLEREWVNVANNSILNSQSKFDEVSNKLVKILRNTGNLLNDFAGNEPLTLPHTLWFGILDLVQTLIHKSTRISTHGLCYYLAIESLNRAPSSFIQFKAIEILFHLSNINNKMFSIIKIDFDQYVQKLNENNPTTDFSEKFQNLLSFTKNKSSDDFNFFINNDNEKGNGKGKEKCPIQIQNTNLTKKLSKSYNILENIANEMTCSIGHEPTDQLCVLKCQHTLSLNNFIKLKQKKCPECREKIEDNEIKYLPQNTIYKNLCSQFIEAGYVSSSKDNQYDSDSGDSDVNSILIKKKKIQEAIKLTSINRSLKSIFQIRKKQHPTYRNAIKELFEKNYKEAISCCKEFLKTFPQSYSMRCILAYTYRCLNDYKQAHLYLHEAIKLKEKRSIAWYISGEIYFRQKFYKDAKKNLQISLNYNAKINNIYIMLGICYMNCLYDYSALENFNTTLQNEPNNHLCLKNCAYIYERQDEYLNTLRILDKLLSINEKDSLILCYYGEILSKMEKYENAIIYFTKANNVDPENVHNLIKRATTYYILQEYDKALLDLNKIIQLDFTNSLAYYYKGLIYHTMKDISSSMGAFEKCIEFDSDNSLAKIQVNYLKYSQTSNIENSHELFTGINQISNINNNTSLLFVRCKIYIELKKYKDAKSDLDRLFTLSNDISFIYLLQKYSKFWSYLCKFYRIKKISELGILNKFYIYMFKIKYEEYEENGHIHKKEYMLKYEDTIKLEGIGWIEYVPFYSICFVNSKWIQFSIETNKDSIDMQIDYIRFTNGCKQQIFFPESNILLPFNTKNVPEAFEDKYFSRKETENLLELKDLINNL